MRVFTSGHSPRPDPSDELNAASDYLATRLQGRLHDVRMFARQEGVVISGIANSYYVKQLAQHAVMQIVSLPIAANEIVVCSTHRRADASPPRIECFNI